MKGKKSFIATLLIVMLVLPLVFSSMTVEAKTKSKKASKAEVYNQIAIQAIPTQDGLVAVFVTNNSTTIIDDLELTIEYLDESGTTIDLDTDGHDMILPGATVVSRMDTPETGYASTKVSYTIDLGCNPSYVNHAAGVVVESNPGADGVIVKITNNSGVDLDEVEYDVVLFKGDQLVTICYPNDIYDLEAGATATEKEYTFSQLTYQNYVYGVDYDTILVVLNQAHTFGL